MRRFYNNGTSFLETITKGTPIGAVGSIVKKIKKSKEDKESRNPDPKTPKMMDTDKDVKKELREKFKFGKNNSKFEKPIGKMKLEVQPLRNPKDKT